MQRSFKIVVVGASMTGKTSIIRRLMNESFDEPATTCGADFYTYTVPVNGETVKLLIWDTAGQERFRSISKSYFRNAAGAILVYDITNIASFDQLSDWLTDLQTLCLPNSYILLVGNKKDLENKRQVGAQQVKDFAQRHKLETIETSALSGTNIVEAFSRLTIEVIYRVSNGQIDLGDSNDIPRTKVKDSSEQPKTKSCC